MNYPATLKPPHSRKFGEKFGKNSKRFGEKFGENAANDNGGGTHYD